MAWVVFTLPCRSWMLWTKDKTRIEQIEWEEVDTGRFVDAHTRGR